MKAGDMDLIKRVNEYLFNFDGKYKLNGDYFRKSLVKSDIYQSL